MSMKFGFFPYEAMNYKAAQRWLDRKAEQGWGLRHVYLGCIARFQRQEKPRHFVDLDIRGFDEETDPDYLQLCTDAGWELVQTLRGMLLFRSVPGKSPAPIQTDGEIEWERFWGKYRPRVWPVLLTLLAVGLLALMLTLPSTSSKSFTAMLAINSTLLYLLYLALGAVYIMVDWVHSRWYLARCRRSQRVEDPGPLSTLLDSTARLQKPLLYLCLIACAAEFLGFSHTVDLNWSVYNDEYTATVEACQEWPVVMARDLGLPDSEDSRHLEGYRSVLVNFLEYRELTDGEGPDVPFHVLTTERYECASETLAKWVIGCRREETRNGRFLWGELEWVEIGAGPCLVFDECYATLDGDGAYLLFRQGRVVALVGCTGLDLTTAQNLESIQNRTLAA